MSSARDSRFEDPSATGRRRSLERPSEVLHALAQAPETVSGADDARTGARRALVGDLDCQSAARFAQELFIAETTVKTHVARILGKLDVRDRVQAVVLAYESGFVAHTGG